MPVGGRGALELAVGTGRVAPALSERGVPVHGIKLSPHMARQLRRKLDADRVRTVGDMTTVRLPRSFRLVYLVANTIMNVTT
jgi:16S rRNA A1518/A1519 N6-dimethyltransferase RsmA/KsgA/DIM1 with predicted DNA glycosylase/AP lyase activity